MGMPKAPISFLTSVLFLVNQIQKKANFEPRLNIPLPIAPAPLAPAPLAPAPLAPAPLAPAPTTAPVPTAAAATAAVTPAVATPTVAQSGTSSLLSQGPTAAATLVEASRYAVLASPMGESKKSIFPFWG